MELSNPQLKYWLGINAVPGWGPITIKNLLTAFHSPQSIWQATQKDFIYKKQPVKLFSSLNKTRENFCFEEKLEVLIKNNIKVLVLQDKNYPYLLKQIYDPPPLLYYQGDLNSFASKKTLAVVGTRKCTQYGLKAVQKVIQNLPNQILIVSGLALGIDTQAHRSALNNNMTTWAVLGSGLNYIYPSKNRKLAEQIKERGALISEFSPETKPEAFHFPMRNRIISGLSKGALVAEAPHKSGALITARLAIEQNREVFAFPGNIFYPTFQGCHQLIQTGAKLVYQASDITDEFNIKLEPKKQTSEQKTIFANPQEEKIFNLIKQESKHLEDIIRESNLPTHIVNSTISILVLKRKVKEINKNYFIAWQT